MNDLQVKVSKTEVLRRIVETGIIPVVHLSSRGEAMTIVDALIEGGINVLEITMTVPGALMLSDNRAQVVTENARKFLQIVRSTRAQMLAVV